uniref:Uncharacterized protein n=1 Tax=Parastrongyloides trichosuri TaxID=131310 RepID=A0A0N4ZH49_PARTI
MNEVKSISDLEKEVLLSSIEIFDHTRILKEENNRFKQNFIETNKAEEFNALIKLNHKILEALDTDILSLCERSNIKTVTSEIDKLKEKISHLTKKQFSQEELNLFDMKTLKPSSIAIIADEKLLDLQESEKSVKANEESLFSTTICEEINEEN